MTCIGCDVLVSTEKKEKIKESAVAIFILAKNNWARVTISSQSAELAYYVLLSLFPILIVVGNLVPFLPIDVDAILPYVETMMPPDIFKVIKPILLQFLNSSSSSAISIGLVTAIWSSSKGFNSLQTVLNSVYGTQKRKNFIIVRVASFLIALAMIVILGAVVFIFVFGEQLIRFIQDKLSLPFDLLTDFTQLKWGVTVIVLMVIFTVIYFLVPNNRWNILYSLPGAVFATVGWLVSSQAFSLYVRFGGGNSVGYGTIGIFIVLMLWLYLVSMILLTGAFVNVMVYQYLNGVDFQNEPKKEVKMAKTSKKQRRKLNKT